LTEEKQKQGKISIPEDEWGLLTEYYLKHEKELKMKGIRNQTMLLRIWILEKYRENISRESDK
jgi:hypothetical protein